jgi:hypothetical protein
LKPGKFAHDAVGESEVCAAKKYYQPVFWLVLWLGPRENSAPYNVFVFDFASLAASRPELVI